MVACNQKWPRSPFGPGDTFYAGLYESLWPKRVIFSGLTYLKGSAFRELKYMNLFATKK